MSILKVKARTIQDSRCSPTLEVDLITDIGLLRSSVPTSLRPNPNAAQELREKSIKIVNDIIGPALIKSNLGICQQKQIDEFLVKLDGTDEKSKLGSVAIFGVSAACCKAGAAKRGLPLYRYIAKLAENGEIRLPVPAFSVIAGGVAANNELSCQDFMILPIGASSFSQALEMGTKVYKEVEKKLAEIDEVKIPFPVNENGAFMPQTLESDKEALTAIDEAIKSAGYDGKVKIAIDMAASAFCKDGMYNLGFKLEDVDEDDNMELEEMLEYYVSLKNEFPNLVSIEDPLDPEDMESWSKLVDLGPQIVSDDLSSMDPERIQEAIDLKSANTLLLRSWQLGGISEVIVCAKMTRLAGWGLTMTAGFGLTDDNFVADLCVGLSCGVFKSGAPGRRYNHLIRIEEELGAKATFAGDKFRS